MAQSASLVDLFGLVWPTILALDVSRYVVAASVAAIVLAVFAVPLAKRRIQPRKASRRDMRREIAYSLSTAFLFSLVGFAVFAGVQHGFFRIYGGAIPGAARVLLEFAAIVVLHDAYFYWMHRALHHRWLFRGFHRVHHQSKTPTPWAAYAFAPPEAFLEAGIFPLAALLIPMHEVTVLLFLTHMIVRNVIGHAGIELFPRWWLKAPLLRTVTTTTHHDLHHSHGGYNFGLYFTWWDRWMGTEHPDYENRFSSVVQSRSNASINENAV